MEPSHTVTGKDCAVLASDTFSFSLPVWARCQITAWGYSTAPCVDCDTKTTRQTRQKSWAVQESIAWHRPKVSLQLTWGSSYLCDALVISYKSLLKDAQQWRVSGSLIDTHTSLSQCWQQRQIMRGWEREVDSCGEKERKETERGWCREKQRKVNSFSVSLISLVKCSSSCCHPLEIITKRDDCQVTLLSITLHMQIFKHVFIQEEIYWLFINQC